MSRRKEPNRCLNCNCEIMENYRGTPKKWCNRKCIDDYRRKTGYWKKWYASKHPENLTKECQVCGRPIVAVGKRKNVNKYCSASCMYTAAHNYKKKMICMDDYKLLMKLKWDKAIENVC